MIFAWLEESFVTFPKEKKEMVKGLMENPPSAVVKEDAEITYILYQNTGITIHLRYHTGGEYGEFNNLSADVSSVALIFTHLF